MKAPERQFEVVVQVILQQHALHVYVKALRVALAKNHLRQNGSLIIDARGEEQIEIANGEVPVRTVAEPECRGLSRMVVIGLPANLTEALEPDSLDQSKILRSGRVILNRRWGWR